MIKKRKVISLIVAVIMVAASLLGCSSSGSTKNSGSSDSKGKTIGVVIWSTDDGLGADSKKALDATAEALGCKLIYRTGDYDAEAQTTAIENLIAAGVDGIMTTVIVDTSTDELLKVCEDADIPFQLMFRNIMDQDAYTYSMASDNFAGYVVENEEQAGKDMVDKLVSQGCKTFGLLNREAGNGVIDRRQKGVEDHLKELGLTYYISTNSNTATATDMTDATDQLIAAHQDIDSLICSSGSNGAIDSIITYLKGTNIKLASFDTPKDVAGSFDDGNLSILTTGSQIDPVYALINLYDKLNGKPMSETPSEIYSNYIYLQSKEDAEAYSEYFTDFQTYTKEEIKNLTTVNNSDMTLDAFKEEVSKYSLENVANAVKAR
jgi:ABC-type sugar transport system substrate-binding protein